jgi:putative ABC transport system permease protein
MRFLLITHIQNARQSLRASRMRSTLTMIGVTIGVASITTILSLSGGASRVVGDQINSLGGNIAVVRPGNVSDPLSGIAQVQAERSFSTSTLTETDVSTIRAVSHIKAVAPIMIMSGVVKGDTVAPSTSQVVATTPELSTISNLQIDGGDFLNTDDANQQTVVIGQQLSLNIFGSETSLGKTVTIRGLPFTVIGVLRYVGQPINYNGVDFDNAAIINLSYGKILNQGAAQIQQIDLQADSVANLSRSIININQALLTNHQNEADFSVLSGSQIAEPTSQLFDAIAGVSAAVAAISLLVGGVGIMNIMLVTVAERTREIGIRKALGASNGDITWQFLIESLAISLGGGAVGYLIGYAVAFLAGTTVLTFYPILNWQVAAVALGVSVGIGVVFGIYPAIRASKKDPIDSLRQYN